VWVVKMRSVLRFIDTPPSFSSASLQLRPRSARPPPLNE
jgi:hypothetical protein